MLEASSAFPHRGISFLSWKLRQPLNEQQYLLGPFQSADFAFKQKEKKCEAPEHTRKVERRGRPKDAPFTSPDNIASADKISISKWIF